MLEAVACIGQVRSIQDEQLGELWFRHRDLGGLVIGSVWGADWMVKCGFDVGICRVFLFVGFVHAFFE